MTEITRELKNKILAVTGEDRIDCIVKVSEMLNGNIGNHQVYSGSSKNILWNDMVIDITTKKKKGAQHVVSFFAWEKGNRTSIKMYVLD